MYNTTDYGYNQFTAQQNNGSIQIIGKRYSSTNCHHIHTNINTHLTHTTVVLSEKGSVLPLLQDIIEDISTFMSSTKITPRLLWFMTKLMKTITNSLWDPWRKTIDDYYTKVNCHDEAIIYKTKNQSKSWSWSLGVRIQLMQSYSN